MGVGQLIRFFHQAGKRILVILLAVILVMLVAPRNVEFELEQEALQAETQVEDSFRLP